MDCFKGNWVHPINLGTPPHFQKLMEDFQGFFENEEEKGPEIMPDFAAIINKSLRRKPNDDAIKSTLAKYRVPSNVPNLQVPAMNLDVTKALRKGANILDFNIRKAQTSLTKGMVPILKWLHDFGSGEFNLPMTLS